MTPKENLYVMGYTTQTGEFICKIGTTNNLERRRKEHNRAYKKTPNYPIADNTEVKIYWSIPLSKYNTFRYEDLNKELFKEKGYEYIRNDRFKFDKIPNSITIKIRKEYVVTFE